MSDTDTDLQSAWSQIINDRIKVLGLSRKSSRALIRQVASVAQYDPARALEIINSLAGAQGDSDAE